MISDAEIRANGIKVLIDTMGEVQAERFISLINRESFDYTKWQRNLFEGMTAEDFDKAAQACHDSVYGSRSADTPVQHDGLVSATEQ